MHIYVLCYITALILAVIVVHGFLFWVLEGFDWIVFCFGFVGAFLELGMDLK